MRRVALRLLCTASRNSEIALVSRRICGVRALVVLHVARARERVREAVEGRVARDLELAADGGHGGRSDAAESASESLQVLARRCSSSAGSGGGGRRRCRSSLGRGGGRRGSCLGCGGRRDGGYCGSCLSSRSRRSGGSRAGSGTGAGCAAGDGVTLVVDSGDRREVRDDAEGGVEGVGLSTCLRGLSVGGCLCGRTGGFGSGVGTTAVHELVAHKLGDNVDVLRRTVVVRSYETK